VLDFPVPPRKEWIEIIWAMDCAPLTVVQRATGLPDGPSGYNAWIFCFNAAKSIGLVR
jgi:hypothetical protein